MKRSLSVLLVEDDLALGPITFHALAHLGHRAVLATSAPGVYAHLRNPHDFELVLLDLQLGDQRSEPLILRLRAEKIDIPIIVVFSAQPLEELERVVRDIGARSFVQKPATVDDIDRAIEAAIA